MTGTMR